LVGVADIHQFLEEGEIFACVKPVDSPAIFLEGEILISRSPVIHPGDVRIVRAIGKPPPGSCFEKEPLQNTVVFATKGAFFCLVSVGLFDKYFIRIKASSIYGTFTGTISTKQKAHKTKLSGGDLDGDQYCLIPLNDMPEFRPKKIHKAAGYEPAKRKLLDRPATTQDIAQFVMEYINSDVRINIFCYLYSLKISSLSE